MSDRVTGIFLERGRLSADQHCLVFDDGINEVQIPAALASVIFLEPGTSVTHRAMQLAGAMGTLLLWVGEASGKVYSAFLPSSYSQQLQIDQAAVCLDKGRRLSAAKRIFALMFPGESADAATTLEQIRGMEGARVKQTYAALATQHGVFWNGRNTGDSHDPVNAALSTAASFLYGVTEAVILSRGYSTSMGIIHSGDPRSFVFDVADTVKFETVSPLAFEIAAEGAHDIRNRTRRACRARYRSQNVMPRLARNVEVILQP